MDIYGVIGWPIEHSLSPAMHNAAFKKLGIDAEYRKFEVKPEDLEDFLLNRKDVKGFNITVPHKVRAMEILKDKASGRLHHRQVDMQHIEFCGAINTVKREGWHFVVENTDVVGFMLSLEHDLRFDHKDKNVLLLGCGGAGRAVIAGLLASAGNRCNKVYVFDNSEKTIGSAKILFGSFSFSRDKVEFISNEQISDKIKECQLLVNASPVGMEEGDERSVIDKSLLHNDLYVYDLVYNRETRLIKDAKEKELRVVDGRGMLASQGAFSFSLWTGVSPLKVLDVMRKELDKDLK